MGCRAWGLGHGFMTHLRFLDFSGSTALFRIGVSNKASPHSPKTLTLCLRLPEALCVNAEFLLKPKPANCLIPLLRSPNCLSFTASFEIHAKRLILQLLDEVGLPESEVSVSRCWLQASGLRVPGLGFSCLGLGVFLPHVYNLNSQVF